MRSCYCSVDVYVYALYIMVLSLQVWCSLYDIKYLEQSVNTQKFSPGPIR